jgi:S-formylglutathione hydrolase FrmB
VLKVSRLSEVSLVQGWFPVLLGLAAMGSFAYAFLRGSRRWRSSLLVLAVSMLCVVALGKAVGVEHRVGSSFPPSFYVWGTIPVFTGLLALLDWRFRRPLARVVGGLSVVLLALFGIVQINAHYSYLPTLGDAVGAPMPDQLAPRETHALVAARFNSAAALSVYNRLFLPRVLPSDPDGGAHDTDAVPSPPPPDIHGVLVAVTIPGVVSHFTARQGWVWLPPAFFLTPRPVLPVVMLLAGVPGDPSNLLRSAHAARVADRYALEHRGVAPILVFPDHNGGLLNDTECVDGPRGNAETYLSTDVPGFIQREFGAAGPGHWAIIGYSEGGTCAVTLALRHPDLFTTFLDISGDRRPNATRGPAERRVTIRALYGGSNSQWAEHDPTALMSARRFPGFAGRFTAGRQDLDALHAGFVLETAARRAGLDTTLLTSPGGHGFAFVRRSVRTNFGWVADRLTKVASP